MNEEGGYTITELVRVAKITRQAYYKWITYEPTAKELQDQHLLALILELEKDHQDCLGSGKMTRLINKCGHLSFPVNNERVRRIMREHGIRADYRCPKRQRKQSKRMRRPTCLNISLSKMKLTMFWLQIRQKLAMANRITKCYCMVCWTFVDNI